jgi:hypothetical protein
MIGITAILTIGFLAGAAVGIVVKHRGVRMAAWGVSGICLLGLLLFAWALPRMLPR